MKEVTKEKTMTTREIADVLGCNPSTITENAKVCLPNKVIENGKPTRWTEAEATALLEKLKHNNSNQFHLSSSSIGSELNKSKDNRLVRTETALTPSFKLAQSASEIVANMDKIQTADFLAFTRAITDAYIEKLQNENADLKRDLDDSDKYTSLLKYCAEHSLPTDMQTIRSEARKIRKAMTQANRLDDIKKIPDSRYPNGVNSYPVDFLDLYFSEGEM